MMKRIENLDFGKTKINKIMNKEDKNMNSVKNQEGRGGFDWKYLTFAFLAALTGFASVAQTTYNLPADRSVTWQGNAGVSGDIPARTTVSTTLYPSGNNDASAIQTAINNCPAGQVVKLNSGTFKISSSIILKSNVTLRGSGRGITIIQGNSGMTGSFVIGVNGGTYGTAISFPYSAGLTKGSTSITTDGAHGWVAGDIILIDQLNDANADPPVTNVGGGGTCTWCGRASGTRSLGQLVMIKDVPSSTTATLEIPLYWTFDPTLTPQAAKYSGLVNSTGLEDLTVDNSLSGSSAQADNGSTVSLIGASNSWVLNVEVIGSYAQAIMLVHSYRNTVRSCNVHLGIPAVAENGPQYSGRGYGIRLQGDASANLIENNQIYHTGAAIVLSGAISGNVISYNFIDVLFDKTGSSWNKQNIFFHGAHPIMNLVEGNYTRGRLLSDWYWGSASHITFFRNRQSLFDPLKSAGLWNLDIQSKSHYINVVGNVFGVSGTDNIFEYENASVPTSDRVVYKLGYTGDGDYGASGNDAMVKITLLRHGNWDAVTNGVIWNGTESHVLPNSLYLSSKPSWWGSCPWPAIGPDITPMYPSAGAVGEGTPWNKTLETGMQEPISNKDQNPDFIISPNPFNLTTNITFTLPEAAQVKVSIFDLNGRCVRNLVNEKLNPGIHTTAWDAKASNGQTVSSGVYVVCMETGKTVQKKMLCFAK